MKHLSSAIAFCETNLKLDDPYDYDIMEYNAEHLYAINDKNKGSGLSFYFNLFTAEVHNWTWYSKLYFKKFMICMWELIVLVCLV